MSFSLARVVRCQRNMLLLATKVWVTAEAGLSCTLRTAGYPAVSRLADAQTNSRDVAQPGRAHPWGG
jgi:hypothetical protein